MTKLPGILLGALLCLYPYGVYFGIQRFGPRTMGLVLLVLFSIRYFSFRVRARSFLAHLLPALSIAGVSFCVLAVVVDRAFFLKLYPVLSNLFLFLLFAVSLRQSTPIIERLARLRHPELTPRGILHTRQATQAWTIFFVLNGLAALYTAVYGSLEVWTLYNGLVSYLLMAVLFLVEYIIRRSRMSLDKREAQGC